MPDILLFSFFVGFFISVSLLVLFADCPLFAVLIPVYGTGNCCRSVDSISEKPTSYYSHGKNSGNKYLYISFCNGNRITESHCHWYTIKNRKKANENNCTLQPSFWRTSTKENMCSFYVMSSFIHKSKVKSIFDILCQISQTNWEESSFGWRWFCPLKSK